MENKKPEDVSNVRHFNGITVICIWICWSFFYTILPPKSKPQFIKYLHTLLHMCQCLFYLIICSSWACKKLSCNHLSKLWLINLKTHFKIKTSAVGISFITYTLWIKRGIYIREDTWLWHIACGHGTSIQSPSHVPAKSCFSMFFMSVKCMQTHLITSSMRIFPFLTIRSREMDDVGPETTNGNQNNKRMIACFIGFGEFFLLFHCDNSLKKVCKKISIEGIVCMRWIVFYYAANGRMPPSIADGGRLAIGTLWW